MAERRPRRFVQVVLGWVGPVLLAAVIVALLVKYQGILTPNF